MRSAVEYLICLWIAVLAFGLRGSVIGSGARETDRLTVPVLFYVIEIALVLGSLTSAGELPPPAEMCLRHYLPVAAELNIFSASSMVKLFGFWTGGKSLKVAAHRFAIAMAPYTM